MDRFCFLQAVLLWAGEPTSLVLDWPSLQKEELGCLMNCEGDLSQMWSRGPLRLSQAGAEHNGEELVLKFWLRAMHLGLRCLM